MTTHRFMLIAFSTALVLLLTTGNNEADAHTSGFPVVRFSNFRLPWPVEVAWDVDDGNPPFVGTHEDSWAIDFSGPGDLNGQAVKSVGPGTLAYGNQGTIGYGLFAQVTHFGNFSSIYAHLSATGAATGNTTQGTWVGNVGSTGESSGPHLHFEARDATGTTFDAWMSGTTISHLAAERLTPHTSNNQGAGYVNHRDRNEAFKARMLAEPGPASSRKGFSMCGAVTYSVYFCNVSVTIAAQDFLGPRITPQSGLHETFSLVATPDPQFVVKVRGVIQKAYQSRVSPSPGDKVSSLIGRPLGEEGLLGGARFQGFEFGSIVVGSTVAGGPPGYNVLVTNSSGATIQQRVFKDYGGAGDCASVNNNVEVNAIDLQQIASHFGSDGQPAYDCLYDYSGAGIDGQSNGNVDVIDLSRVAAQAGVCGPEL